MRIFTPRLLLRDFESSDFAAFAAYQVDPRYRRLYGFDEDRARRHAREIFERFLAWQGEEPRRNHQLGIFERGTERLCGCTGLRRTGFEEGQAAFGIELNPDDWGRHGLAIEAASALISFGFSELDLRLVLGSTGSGNERALKLARWFGAELVSSRPGPDWMITKGWREVDWALTRERWERSDARQRLRLSSRRSEPRGVG